MRNSRRLLLLAAFFALLIPLILTGNAGAMYMTDGTKEVSAGVYENPQDGVCVVGLKFDGTLDVDKTITNYKDCIVATTSAIKALGQTACGGGAGNDGYKHAWSTSICVDNVTDKNPISRVDLDNTTAMCKSKGGTVLTTGLCTAYGWQWMNVKSAEAIPYRGTITPSGYKGRTSSDELGFCYTPMRMTSAAGYSAEGTGSGCPSWHNVSAKAGAEWTAGTDGVLYQSQASYDAGLGWTFASSQCVYAYGVSGYTNGVTTAADSTVTIPANTFVDSTTTPKGPSYYTTMGDCLAIGYSWDNWLPYGNGTGTGGNASTITVPTTLTSSIVKLDATTAVASGGGKFYSGTGSICTKCHTDQSRSYMERYKPGFVKTGHKLAGDTSPWTTVGDDWSLKGVQCAICHATGKPTQQDLGNVIYPDGSGANAGLPRAASGHNQTEYGSHLTNVCFTCHGTMPGSGNPAAQIPVSSGELATTSKNLAPIGNQFLNSPHAKFTGSNTRLDLTKKANYASTFEGYVCRTALGAYTSTLYVAANQSQCETATAVTANIPAGLMSWPGGKWFTGSTNPTVAAGCYDSALTCAQRGFSGAGGSSNYGFAWRASYDSYAQPWGASIVNGGTGICGGIGNGSIVTTAYQSGAEAKIHNLDSTTNTNCTNPGDGSATSGAASFWVRDGEAAGTSIPAGGTAAMAPSDQGNCMTCHDVHWSLDSTDPEAEPFRRECTTCHQNSGTSASGAPQIVLANINHLHTAGTPLENMSTDPDGACEICHMPKLTSAGSPMHIWRISTDASYVTAGTTAVNLDADNNAWVDLDAACGQCHGGGLNAIDNPPLAGMPYRTKAQLALVAKGMHASSGLSYPVTFTAAVVTNTLQVNFAGSVTCGGNATCLATNFSYDWDWDNDGVVDNTTTATGITPSTTSHTFGSAGSKTVKLTVRNAAGAVGSVTRTGTLPAPVTLPVANATCVWNANTWNMGVTDTSTAPGTLQIVVDWGDGSAKSYGSNGGVFSRTYNKIGTFPVILKATDSKLQSSTYTCTTPNLATPAYFAIGGTVKKSTGAVVASATVQLLNSSNVVLKSMLTGTGGTFSFGSLKPGTYNLKAVKSGYVFPAQTPFSIGPDSLSKIITATTP